MGARLAVFACPTLTAVSEFIPVTTTIAFLPHLLDNLAQREFRSATLNNAIP
ncbi:MAG: hypothetical protein HY935_03390 [Nitrosomonadales bacterium]|nr:hypothetical protein [Nitrosomonadales bacterium]